MIHICPDEIAWLAGIGTAVKLSWRWVVAKAYFLAAWVRS